MGETRLNKVRASIAHQRIAEKVRSLDDSTSYVLLVVATPVPDEPSQFAVHSIICHEPELPQIRLLDYQRLVQIRLWENALDHGQATRQSTPLWAQPPRLLWDTKWYDLILFGVSVGIVCGVLLGALKV